MKIRKEYQLIIHKTNNYPYYKKEVETFKDLESASKRLDEVSKELMSQCRAETLQDYNLEIRLVSLSRAAR